MVIQAFRDNIPKWVTAIILILIIGPFALWGINSYFTASGDTSVAKVNGDEISPQDFQQAYQSQYQQLEQFYGASFKPEMINEKQLHEEVLERLINQTLLNQQAVKLHYGISDAGLVTAIQQIPAFQVDGKFSSQVYQTALSSIGLTPAAFEQRQRQALAVQQLQDAIQNSAFATQQELDSTVAVSDQQRRIAYLTISMKRYLDQARIPDGAIATYYKTHADEFMTPEKVTLAYVELDEAQLAKDVNVSDAELQLMYQQQLASFKRLEARQAQHILIAVNSDNPKADAAAKAKAEEILKQLRAGANFGKLAEQYSDDPGSAKNGGDLGWVERGAMVKPFEDALFSIPKVGDVVGPIRTRYGYHIIKLDGIRAPATKPFDQVRAQLLAEYQKKKADDSYYALGDQLANLVYEHPDSLAVVSKQLNLPIHTVADVTRDAGNGIAANPAVRKAAFSSQVLAQGNNSDPVQIGTNHVVVIRVQDHIASKARPLASVRDQIIGILRQQQATQRAAQVATAIETALKAGQDAAQTAKQYGATITPAKFVSRTDTTVPSAVLLAAFTAPQPVGNTPRVGAVMLPGGDQAVFLLSDIKPGNPASLGKDQHMSELRDLTRLNGEEEFAAYLANLRAKAKIKINRSNIQQE